MFSWSIERDSGMKWVTIQVLWITSILQACNESCESVRVTDFI